MDLTHRESEVINFLLQGYSNKEIAEELGINVLTVKVHLQHIYMKRGVYRRDKLIAAEWKLYVEELKEDFQEKIKHYSGGLPRGR
jgi:DNA-binding NarL/FixJ family response regulator